MTFADLLIIYLSFGAPVAVYKYLQTRGAGTRRRATLSILTFFFWIPTAFEIGYLYLRNAYFNSGFVSQGNLDSETGVLRDLRDEITSELFRVVRGSSLHDVRETVERYAGLASELRRELSSPPHDNHLFEAAGRKKYELGQICLMRRNLHRLQRHHNQARQDFLALLEDALDRFPVPGAVDCSIELATQLDDPHAVLTLRALKKKRGEVWNPEQQHLPQSMAAVPSIVMTASLNNE